MTIILITIFSPRRQARGRKIWIAKTHKFLRQNGPSEMAKSIRQYQNASRNSIIFYSDFWCVRNIWFKKWPESVNLGDVIFRIFFSASPAKYNSMNRPGPRIISVVFAPPCVLGSSSFYGMVIPGTGLRPISGGDRQFLLILVFGSVSRLCETRCTYPLPHFAAYGFGIWSPKNSRNFGCLINWVPAALWAYYQLKRFERRREFLL